MRRRWLDDVDRALSRLAFPVPGLWDEVHVLARTLVTEVWVTAAMNALIGIRRP